MMREGIDREVEEILRMKSQGCDIRKSLRSDINNTHRRIQRKTGVGISNQEDRRLIFDDENLRGGFAQVPNVVLRNPDLSSNAVRLYTLLISHAWQSNECWPSQKLLCQEMGCKKDTIMRTLSELKRHKLISWERMGLGKTNIYHIRKLSDGYLPRQFVDRSRQW